MKLPSSTKRFISEVAQGGWVILLLFLAIAIGQLWVSHHYSPGWGFVSAVAAVAIWLVIRPWRLGLLSQDSRREVCLWSTLVLVGWMMRAALEYWKI